MPTELQSAALEYVTAGLHILALTGKKPNGRVHGDHWTYEESFHGVPQDDEIPELWNSFDESMGTTGIAILIPPSYLVADVDTERAAECLLSLGYERSPGSPVAQTKNGLHVWFFAPGEMSNRWVGDGRVDEFKDNRALLFKGYGGYVVAPPSLHFDAKNEVDGTYQWGSPLVRNGYLQEPDEIPAGAKERFKLSDTVKESQPDKESMTQWRLVPEEGVPWWKWPKVWDYQTAGLERAIEEAADGNQNNIIHWAALTCRDEGVPYEVAMERLMAAAVRGNHPKNRARDTIRGAYKRAARG